MKQKRVKSSVYIAENLYERAMLLKESTGLPFNTICVLALEDYLQSKGQHPNHGKQEPSSNLPNRSRSKTE